MGKGKKGKKGGSSGSGGGGAAEFFTIDVDPRRVRFAHSKIKPVFSGCGRTIEQTLKEIREGETKPSDLPVITVVVGPDDPESGEACLFSLNNRRLFVFKACREEGLLGNDGLIRVRARALKPHERDRYTLDRCSLQAKFLFAPKASNSSNSSLAAGGPCGEPAAQGDTAPTTALYGETRASTRTFLRDGQDEVHSRRASAEYEVTRGRERK